jgi:cytochrome c-type biogenesis protein CcmE
MKPRHKRLAIIAGALASLGVAAALVLNALDSNIALYVTPTEVSEGKAPHRQDLPHRRHGRGRLDRSARPTA